MGVIRLMLKPMRKLHCWVFLCVLFSGIYSENSAEEPRSDEPLYLMEEIVVTEKYDLC